MLNISLAGLFFYNIPVQMDVEEHKEQRENKIGNIVKYFGAVMGLFYVVIGGSMLIGKIPLPISQIIQYLLGSTLLLYGAFRLYRIFVS